MTHRAKFLSGGTLLLSLALAAAATPTATSRRQNPPLTAQVPKPSANAAPGVSFVDVTKTAGLGGFRFVSGTPAKDYLVDAPGAGCAFIDYDNDGWLDIYLINGSTIDALRGKAKAPRAALYRNNRDGSFTDVTDKAGVANERWGQGVCVGDFDNDGWEDLYVTNGDGTFTDVAEFA